MMDNVVASICSSTSNQKNRSPPRRYNVKVHQHSFTIYYTLQIVTSGKYVCNNSSSN